MAAIVRAAGISLHFDSACHLWYTVIDVGLGFLRIHCTYDVLYCFQWWTLLHFHAVIMVWAIRIGGCKSAMFLSNNILIVYVSSRLLGGFLKVGFLGRVVIDLVLCAGTPCLWVRRSSFWTRELLVLWNLVLVCYKMFVQQDLSSCGVLVLFVASVVEASCRCYHTRSVMHYYRICRSHVVVARILLLVLYSCLLRCFSRAGAAVATALAYILTLLASQMLSVPHGAWCRLATTAAAGAPVAQLWGMHLGACVFIIVMFLPTSWHWWPPKKSEDKLLADLAVVESWAMDHINVLRDRDGDCFKAKLRQLSGAEEKRIYHFLRNHKERIEASATLAAQLANLDRIVMASGEASLSAAVPSTVSGSGKARSSTDAGLNAQEEGKKRSKTEAGGQTGSAGSSVSCGSAGAYKSDSAMSKDSMVMNTLGQTGSAGRSDSSGPAGASNSETIAFYDQANEGIPDLGSGVTSAGDPIQQRQQIADLLSTRYDSLHCGSLQNWQTYSRPREILDILRVGVASAPSVMHVALEQISDHHRNALCKAQRLVNAEAQARAQAQKEAEEKAARSNAEAEARAAALALAPAQAHPTQNTLWRYAIRNTRAMGAAVSVSTSAGSGQARGSSSATTVVQELAKAEDPPLHTCSYDHFEEQSGAWCGMHALNNLLRGDYVDKDACTRAAAQIRRALGGAVLESDHLDPQSGFLSIDVINLLGSANLGIHVDETPTSWEELRHCHGARAMINWNQSHWSVLEAWPPDAPTHWRHTNSIEGRSSNLGDGRAY